MGKAIVPWMWCLLISNIIFWVFSSQGKMQCWFFSVFSGWCLGIEMESWRPHREPLNSTSAGRRNAKSPDSREMPSSGIISAWLCWVLCSVMHLELIWELSQLILGGKTPTLTWGRVGGFAWHSPRHFWRYFARKNRRYTRNSEKGQWPTLPVRVLLKWRVLLRICGIKKREEEGAHRGKDENNSCLRS